MKAILVIDKPDACYECPLYRQTQEVEECRATYIPLSRAEVNDIPSWCPLKPMPNRIEVRGKWISEEYQQGWNACLEVLK